MKLQYIHRGLQFFFVTVALKGRPQVLSQLIESERRPKLTAAGAEMAALEAQGASKVEPRSRFIRMMPCSLPANYDPSAEDSRELAADRLLILSGFTDTPAVPARDIRRYFGASHQFRQNCLKRNELAAALCAKAECLVEEEKNSKGIK